ncbi:oligosaccharide flippase family protein [Kluyvera cryocrescens]|uniref:oligosaccharide flippase family protein n=1 Tax=Kluyvera cryocrescens TaxID=580 RepID=UPI00224A4F13|nr:oligosaccharide flippase family protein [Kluyvera cryocrescens]MCX2869415.1 oligosaccharide flippase family protein [Kluyvera cryocrescens]MEB6633160.1 oligosaccharide flippase family protein [Kluyvera cryocrescens]
MNKKIILSYAVGPIGSAIVSFASVPLIAWFFTVEDVGKISIFNAVVSLATLVFCLGLDQAFAREYHGCKDKAALLKETILPGAVLLLLLIVLTSIYDARLLSRLIFDESSKYLTVMVVVCFIAQYIARFLSLILRMQERAMAYSMSQLLPKVLFLLFLLTGVGLGYERNLKQLLTAYVLSACLVFFIYLYNTRYDWLPAIKATTDEKQIKVLLKFGLPLVFGSLASWGLNVADRFFLRYYSSFSELGIYSVTMSVSAVATLFAGIFNTIWAPLVYRWLSEGKVDTQKIDNIGEHVLAAIYFAIVGCGLVSWIVPYLLPSQYSPIEYLLPVCLFAPLLYTLSEVTAVGIAISRRTMFSMLASVTAMLCNLLGNYLLVPKYGAAGAATSTLLSFVLFYVLRTEFSKHVWRKIPTLKTYMAIGILSIYVLFNLWVVKGGITMVGASLVLFALGCFIFLNSLKLTMVSLISILNKNKIQ